MSNTHPLSLVIPVYDEEDNLRPLHSQITKSLASLDRDYEIILVDDGSRDNSLSVMHSLAESDSHVRVIVFERNCGQSAAFAAGFQAASHPIIVTMDADLQNDPADIPKLLQLYDQGHDMVVGWRAKRKDIWIKRVGSKIANAIRNALTGKTVRDTGCSLKVMRASMARKLPVFNGMHRFLPTLMVLQQARLAEVEVNHRAREHGTSKYGTLDRALAGLYDLVGVRWLRSRYIDYSIREDTKRGTL
ncbi:MAG: glycosyltransferase family 2 protein [Desulfovibrio sp.]|uniref:glycosyltransferase family 2 protein n=1 Tax=Desulfovibrio sp. 7SRBS1 TaxID=3378064 RepID=UPI003B3E3164